MKPIIRYLVTGAIVLAAIAVGVHRWRVYLENPWTRDGQVQANVIQIAPRVSGPIVTLPIRDNQFVHAGDLLLEIDPRTYQASLDQARAQLDQAGGNIEASMKQVESARAGIEVSRATINQAEEHDGAAHGGHREEQGRVRAAAGHAAQEGHLAESPGTRPGDV